MGNGESSQQIEQLKAKTMRKTFDRAVLNLREYQEGASKEYQAITLILHDSVLSTCISNDLENSFEVDKDVFVKLMKSNELVVVFFQDKNPVVWKFRSGDINVMKEWEQALVISKRPRFVQDCRCQKCKGMFGTFRRKHHCRNCGRILCDECCSARVILESMGYNEKKRVCEECLCSLKKIKEIFDIKQE